MIKNLKEYIRSLMFSPVFFRRMVNIFRITAKTGRGGGMCLEKGFLPMPVHFYSPVPDIKDLEKRMIWGVRSKLSGIDFREEEQIALLKDLGNKYSDECRWPLSPTQNQYEYYIDNQSFSYGCAASTYCSIRHFKPGKLIEIGSGMSSMVISNALKMNRSEKGHHNEYIVVDPYPADFIKNSSLNDTRLIEGRVELQELSFFDQLTANDILFIDSGHCVKIGGDVNFLLLDVMPRLKPGVIIHIHDIGIPYEYSKAYATSETFRQFWTEQYLLQSFLCFNSEFEILLAMNYLMTDCSDIFREVFPYYNSEIHSGISGSFWIRRKLKEKGH